LALRLARRWQGVWQDHPPDPAGHDNAWRRIADRYDLTARIQSRLDFIGARSFPVARRKLAGDWRHHLGELARLTGLLRDELLPTPSVQNDLRHWLAEVRQLVDEFGEVEVRWNENVVRAVTEPITLRGIELGRFGIDFHWKRFESETGVRCFDIVALEPNPASGRDEIVHPHVNGRDLCAGDAEGPVHRALDDGRIVEAFLMIRSVLTTYNRSSPYVSLEAWEGSPCSDCGSRVRDDDRTACEGCDRDLCQSCSQLCERCHSPRCGHCLDACAVCECSCCSGCMMSAPGERRVCPSCFETCDGCGRSVPKDELEDDLCTQCVPEEDSDDEDEECVPQFGEPTATDLHAAGVAEAAVPLPRGADGGGGLRAGVVG
jgi:hypothetical protein